MPRMALSGRQWDRPKAAATWRNFFRKEDDMINNDERERRLIEFLALEVRGLVVRRELPTARRNYIFRSLITPTWAFRAARTLH
jgi:hypothetical protein